MHNSLPKKRDENADMIKEKIMHAKEVKEEALRRF